MRPHSLRTRLVATTLLLVALASAVVGVATTLVLQHFLYTRLDSDLRSASVVFSRFEGTPQTGQATPPPDFGGGGPRPPPGARAAIAATGQDPGARDPAP